MGNTNRGFEATVAGFIPPVAYLIGHKLVPAEVEMPWASPKDAIFKRGGHSSLAAERAKALAGHFIPNPNLDVIARARAC